MPETSEFSNIPTKSQSSQPSKTLGASERIDILDEYGKKTGQTTTRDEIHRFGYWHRVAVVAIIDAENRILLQQRCADKLTNPEKWDIAAAGHVDAGEDALVTAMRETAEEVGVSASATDFQYILTYQKTSQYSWQGEEMTDRQIYDCYLLRLPKIEIKDLTLQAEEVQAAKLCDLAEFKAMISSDVMVNRQPFYDKIVEIMEAK